MPIRPGDLRQRVTLVRKTVTPRVGKPGSDTTWTPFAMVWAQVVGINGREAVIGQALQGVSYFKIVVRYRGDIGDADQVSYQPAGAATPLTLNIRSATDPDGRREQLLILADTASSQAMS